MFKKVPQIIFGIVELDQLHILNVHFFHSIAILYSAL